MKRKYWLDLFTGKTWEEFLKAGAKVSGFRESRKRVVQKIKPGDYFICYLTGISRIVGVLEVKSGMFHDQTRIWEDATFPCRLKVKLKFKLEPETAIPIKDLDGKLKIFENLSSPHAWTGFFRASPNEFSEKDGLTILEEIKNAVQNPQAKEFDEKKYWRKPRTFESNVGVVTVPDEEDENLTASKIGDEATEDELETTHEEIQYILAKLGSELGLDIWVARNDRNKKYNGLSFTDLPRFKKNLPRQFDEATNRTIELIDVLWLQGDAIVAAFEVEHTSAIYSGLLRMSDLISMQPNINMNLYIVAPDERANKVFNEINRPTFARLKPALPKICKFISYSKLKAKMDQMGQELKYLKPEFIDSVAESCEPDEA